MLIRTIFILIVVILPSLSNIATGADQDDAKKASKEIVSLLARKQFQLLWNSLTSKFFKDKMTKDSFVANMSIGRAQLGELTDSKLIDIAYSETDPADPGYKGKIYAFNYLNTYSAGKFYERVVVMKEDDGQFRLSGLWGSPAPTQ